MCCRCAIRSPLRRRLHCGGDFQQPGDAWQRRGWQKAEFDLTGQDFRARGRRCDEQITVIKKLFSGEMVEFHGEFFDLIRS